MTSQSVVFCASVGCNKNAKSVCEATSHYVLELCVFESTCLSILRHPSLGDGVYSLKVKVDCTVRHCCN